MSLRKQLLYRGHHRGTKEADFLFGGFAGQHLETFSEEELRQFSGLLDCMDADLMDWLQDVKPVPKAHDHAVFEKLRSYYHALLK